MTATRRLAAILAADVAGYSRLMGADEEGTHERLKGHLRELVEPKIAEHRGRIVKNTGDGFLAEFGSVVDAVRCAVEIQRGMANREPDMAEERRIRFRIGVNLGDVIVEEHDIFGDGVNVAARLEGLAEPGGICVSRMVRDQIRDKLDFAFEDLGEQSVKNIARPVRVYALRPEGQAGSPIATAASESSSSPPSNAPRLSIVVLPFTNLSDDREQQYFADGITEDLTTDLSRIAGMLVISRNTAFTYQGKRVDTKQIGHELAVRYVLEGSVRRSGNQVRVNAQLIDADTDAHLWAERFNGDASDLFALQDEVTSRIANALGVELIAAEAARPTGHPDALDHTLRGRAALLKPETPDTFAEAISGSLPRPRGGVAQSQCRTRQPRRDEGDVGTIALGGHVARCENCANTVIAYNSCRNRHCPKCQAAAAKKWLAEREAELLPVGYFHLVFTLPGPIADIAYHNKATIYGLLFTAAAEATLTIAADPKRLGAKIGITAVLHSWGSAMTHHPHVHMIVPGGGISLDGTRWVSCRPRFFLPVRVLSRLFRRLFLGKLLAAHQAGHLAFFGDHAALAAPRALAALLAPLRNTEWVVYAKKPFAGPQAVLAYLSRYTHRVAISNRRLISADQTDVTFTWKDYRIDGPGRYKTMTLATHEFIRRFLMHVLPKGLHRIRHYGLFANSNRAANIARGRELLGVSPRPRPAETCKTAAADEHRVLPRPCRCCGGRMIIIETFAAGYQPKHRPAPRTAAVGIDTS